MYKKILILIIFILIISFTIYPVPNVYKFKGRGKKKTLLLIAGTHGNEISGSEYLTRNIKHYKDYMYDYNLIVIPRLNSYGISLNMRYIPNFPFFTDINRIYYTESTHNFVKSYIQYIDNADLIIDFHDAWGFQYLSNSTGSGLYPNFIGKSEYYAKTMVDELNKYIREEYLKFISKELSIDVNGTLHNYCTYKKIPYILVETSGQNDILPLENRMKQIDVLLKTLYKIF